MAKKLKQKIKEYKGEPICLVQEKLDGHYAEVHVNKKGRITVVTKKRNRDLWPKLQKISHLRAPIERLPAGTTVIGELHSPGIPATSIPTLINDASGRLQFGAYAIPMWSSIYASGMTYEQAKNLLNRRGFHPVECTRIAERDTPISLLEPDIQTWLKAAKRRGLEGWVLKESHLGPAYKIKVQKTVDAVVTNVLFSDSDSFKGGLKALVVSVYDGSNLVEIANVGSGFTKEFRMQFLPSHFVGRVAEIKYDSVAAQGRLRFPTFLRFRDDEKKPEECDIAQIQ